jgi:hypothetical protein
MIGVCGVDEKMRVIKRTLIGLSVGRDELPRVAAVGRTPEDAFLGLDQRVDALRVARRDRDADAALQPVRQSMPL